MMDEKPSMTGAAPLWYVIRTKAGEEHRASQNIFNQDIETFLPLFKDRVYRNGSLTQVIRPLFPNYLFARLDLLLHFHKVKYTRGVGKILGSREGPLPISDEVVRTIKGRLGKDNLVELEEKEVKEGDLVQVKSGPLKDLVGIFQKKMSDRVRVKILLNLIGKDVPVQLPIWQIEKVT